MVKWILVGNLKNELSLVEDFMRQRVARNNGINRFIRCDKYCVLDCSSVSIPYHLSMYQNRFTSDNVASRPRIYVKTDKR